MRRGYSGAGENVKRVSARGAEWAAESESGISFERGKNANIDRMEGKESDRE